MQIGRFFLLAIQDLAIVRRCFMCRNGPSLVNSCATCWMPSRHDTRSVWTIVCTCSCSIVFGIEVGLCSILGRFRKIVASLVGKYKDWSYYCWAVFFICLVKEGINHALSCWLFSDMYVFVQVNGSPYFVHFSTFTTCLMVCAFLSVFKYLSMFLLFHCRSPWVAPIGPPWCHQWQWWKLQSSPGKERYAM
jgi:hypothetical protein